MSWRKHFTPVDNSGLPLNTQPRNTAATGLGQGVSSYENWLPEVYTGSPNRLMRYMSYDAMDQDPEVNQALDTIAEFGTQEEEYSGLPFQLQYNESPSETESEILTESLRKWCNLNKFYKRAFRLFRNTIKYGDQIFIRDPQTYELHWVDLANVEKVIVYEVEGEGKRIETYFIKNLDFHLEEQVATTPTNPGNRPYGAGQGIASIMNPTNSNAGGFLTGAIDGNDEGTPVDAKHIVHISMTEGMDQNWPFGNSVLESVFKVFKQKEMLEDSILIYRVHRAPERRVFFIDVGNMPPHKAKQYLEQVKYEVQQKRIPGRTKDGQNIADAAYNPMSMLEDYYFAQTAEGRGSKVDTLPGGENLGQIDDLKYFNNRLMRGLRVPSSYLPTGPEDGTAQYNDGKVGVAYIQEYRFAKYVERIQRQIQDEMDTEFKMFLKWRGVELDSGSFYIEFNKPMNFSSYRDIQMQTERAQLLAQVQSVPFLSNQFKLKKYLGLTEDEIKENERLWRQENVTDSGADPEGNMDLGGVGIRPAPAGGEMDLDAELGADDLGDIDMGDDMGGDDLGGEEL